MKLRTFLKRNKLQTKKALSIKLGDSYQPIHPISLENGIELSLLILPYYSAVTEALTTLQGTPEEIAKVRVLRALVQSMTEFPEDFVRMAGLVLDRSPEWLKENLTPIELFRVLVEVNEFVGLWDLLKLSIQISLVQSRNTDG